jgi:sterol desaturase/sphingolipid hydroxylase (fatty acid hydroxylase superfamily)
LLASSRGYESTAPGNPDAVNARRLVIFHAFCTIAWTALLLPTVLVWRESILWLAIMSVWANVISHATAWQAARAERAAERTSDQAAG